MDGRPFPIQKDLKSLKAEQNPKVLTGDKAQQHFDSRVVNKLYY